MELLWERMLAFYLGLMMLIVPDEKRGVRQRRLAKGFAVCTALLCIGLVLGGAFLLAALDSAWGLLPLGIGAGLSLIQIIAGAVLCSRGGKKKRRR